MARGIKRINCVRGLYYPKSSRPNSLYVVKPDQGVVFAVSEWYPDTTAADKKKDITWIIQTADRKTILNQILAAPNQNLNFVIPKKLCGNLTYYIEASLTGSRDKATTGLQVRGLCTPLIVSSKWSTQAGGGNIKNQASIIKYGHVVHLNLQTEGLCQKKLIIEVYNRIGLKRKDYVVGTYTNVDCIDGEVNLEIRNTFSWMALVKNIKTDEDFYVMVKDAATNQYVKDSLGQELHAVYLKVRNEVVTTVIDGARNNKVAKVGQAQPNPIKYEQCKFNKIEISEIKTEDGVTKAETTALFNEGQAKSNGATSVSFSTVAPDQSIGKELILAIGGFSTQKCQSKKHTAKKIIFREVGQALGNDDKKVIIQGQSTVKEKVYSNISRLNAITYIWAKKTTPNQFWYYINSCRYYDEPVRPTVIINAYPDVKWELAFEFQVGVSNYKAANMPAGNIYRRHQEMARQQGYKRWLMNEQGKVPISIGVGLSAEWNNKRTKVSYTQEFEAKIEKFAKLISKTIEILQNAINFAQSAAKATSIPVGFNVRYPKLTVAASWYLENNGVEEIAVVGELSVGAKPFIGAEVIVDIIGCAIAAASYGTTGNPAAARLINKFRGGLERLGASVTFTATFYGELEVSFDALKIHSAKGMQMNGKTTIGGKMGATILLSIEVGGKLEHSRFSEIIPFKASASLQGDAYFGGDLVFDSDAQGVFVMPVLKFSGVKVTGEVKGEIGWWKSSFKLEEVVIKEDSYTMAKYYII